MHPEKSLFALLLPGTVFCILMFMDWWKTDKKPQLRVYGRELPIVAIYVIVFVGGPIWLIMLLAQSLRRKS